VGAVAVCVLITILATARAAHEEPAVAPPPPRTAEPDAEPRPEDPLWTIGSEPVERIGYRHGRKQAIEVVPLGPDAVEVEVRTARAFLAMRAAAAKDGVDLRLESGFRTAAEQRALFKAWRRGRGNKAARPGRSNHQSGRALDIAVLSSPGARAWLEANAIAFGFKRTVKREPWHWEYVDAPVARGATKRISRKTTKSKRVAGVRNTGRRPSKAKPTRRSTASRR
jgi:hypothetical protein